MKKFKGHKSAAQIVAACAANGWKCNTERYDQGWDHIDFEFEHGNLRAKVIYSSVNGSFSGFLDDGTRFTSYSDKLDDEPWFDALLNFVYTMEEGEETPEKAA